MKQNFKEFMIILIAITVLTIIFAQLYNKLHQNEDFFNNLGELSCNKIGMNLSRVLLNGDYRREIECTKEIADNLNISITLKTNDYRKINITELER